MTAWVRASCWKSGKYELFAVQFRLRKEFDWLAGEPTSFAFPAAKHDYLLHLATATSAQLGQTDALEMLHTKHRSITRVLAFAAAANIQRALVTSSGAVYGQQPAELERIPESFGGAPDPLYAASAYGNGKRLIEQVCALTPELDIVIARCFSFIGPHLPLDARFAVGNFVRNALDRNAIVVQGDGRPIRSYLYASDLTIWLLQLLLRGEPHRAYNVGSDEAISVGDLARLVAAQRQLAVEIRGQDHTPRTPANRYVPDVSRCASELSLSPTVSLSDAIAKTLLWCESAAR